MQAIKKRKGVNKMSNWTLKEKSVGDLTVKIEGKELILTVSGKNRKDKDQTVVIKFTKEKN